MDPLIWTVGAAIFNVLAGGALVLGMYSLMERHIGLGAMGGIGVGAIIIYVQATLGEQWFTVSVSEMKLLVIAAAVGAAFGVTATVLAVEPEIS